MRRYAKIYRQFFLSSLARELEFRVNFLAKILRNLTWAVFFSLIVLVIFQRTKTVAGWTLNEMLVLTATSFLTYSIHAVFATSLSELPQQIRLGTLDFVVTKPVDSQFWVSSRRFSFDRVADIFVQGSVIAWFGSKITPAPDALQWAGFVWLLLCGVAIFYGITLLLMTLSIYFVRVDNLWVLGEMVFDVSRYPLEIFPRLTQRIMLFGLPLGAVAYVPTMILRTGWSPQLLAIGTSWAVFMLVATRLFWRRALRDYSSASS